MTGCSGEGIIGTRLADESNHCVIVLAIADPRLQLITAGFDDAANSVLAGEEIGSVFRKHLSEDSGCILVFPCGLNSVADEFLFELEKSLGKKIPIIGSKF